MTLLNKCFLYVVIIVLFQNCDLITMYDGGTHGSIKAYAYSSSRDTLLTSIKEVILTDDNLTKINIHDSNDTYIKLKITSSLDSAFYVFRFYGDSIYWKQNRNYSKIFITSMKLNNNEYQRDWEIGKNDRKVLIEIFELQFISKLNQKVMKTIDRNPSNG